MADQFTLEDLKSILVNRIGMAESDIGDDTATTFEDIGLDSLAFLELQHEMETRYGFVVDEAEAQDIHTFEDAIQYMNRQLQASS